jgi:hypothetical protein
VSETLVTGAEARPARALCLAQPTVIALLIHAHARYRLTTSRHQQNRQQTCPRTPQTLATSFLTLSPFSLTSHRVSVLPSTAPPSFRLITHLGRYRATYSASILTETPRTYTTMSGWGLGWFGGGQTKKEAPKKAILQLRGQLEMLNKREKHLQNQMEEQDTLARKFVSSNKAGTLFSNSTASPHEEGMLIRLCEQRPRQRYEERSSSSTLSSKHRHKS